MQPQAWSGQEERTPTETERSVTGASSRQQQAEYGPKLKRQGAGFEEWMLLNKKREAESLHATIQCHTPLPKKGKCRHAGTTESVLSQKYQSNHVFVEALLYVTLQGVSSRIEVENASAHQVSPVLLLEKTSNESDQVLISIADF